MGKVTRLGHVGIFVRDMDTMLDFYTRILGLTLTDHANGGVAFLSARPEDEHHEIVFACSGDGQRTSAGQVSFPVDSLADLKVLYRKLQDAGCRFERLLNHGIAFGVYFRDPEDNVVEVYWPTGIDYPQPCGEPLDLEASDEDLLRRLEEMPARATRYPHRYGRDAGKRLAAGAV